MDSYISMLQVAETIREEEDEESEMLKDMTEYNNMKYVFSIAIHSFAVDSYMERVITQ